MNRHYDTAEYREIVQNLRNTFPNCAITTDIMVGFPGETEEEFQENLAFAKEIAFARVHVFAYSRRPGTKANDAPNQLTNQVKSQRSKAMSAVTNQTQQDFLNAQLGTVQSVLVEREVAPSIYEGYTPNYTSVRFPSETNLCGTSVPVKLQAVEQDYCTGIIAQ